MGGKVFWEHLAYGLTKFWYSAGLPNFEMSSPSLFCGRFRLPSGDKGMMPPVGLEPWLPEKSGIGVWFSSIQHYFLSVQDIRKSWGGASRRTEQEFLLRQKGLLR